MDGWKTVEFFWQNLTIIDFLILGIGVFLLLYQFLLFPSLLWTKRKKWESLSLEDKQKYKKRIFWEFQILSSLIEILPILGILGTVWGIMNALGYIQSVEAPTIRLISQRLAPALSTTFLGLSFAILNLLLYTFTTSYVDELFYEADSLLEEDIPTLGEDL